MTPFWHGVLLSSCVWMLLLGLGRWYWRGKIKQPGARVNRISELHAQAPDWRDESGCGCTNRRMCAKHHAKAMEVLGNPMTGVIVTAVRVATDGEG